MKNLRQKVIVMGLGYIGLPTASMLATKGHAVVGVDVNPATVQAVNAGQVPFVEPDLDVLVRAAVHSGNLRGVIGWINRNIARRLMGEKVPFMQLSESAGLFKRLTRLFSGK